MSHVIRLLFLVPAILYLLEGAASATTGHLRGYWKFQQYAGGFCRDSGDPALCVGARYVEADYATAQPIRAGKIYVEDQHGNPIGDCSTSSSGYYDCTWNRAVLPTQIRASFHFEHQTGRFKVLGETGGVYTWSSQYYSVSNLENKYIGTLTMPKMGISQLFDAASRVWEGSFDDSWGLYLTFSGVEFRAYVDPSTNCQLCAEQKVIKVASFAKAYETFNVMHELGHVADYVLDPRDQIPIVSPIYCYPNTTGGPCSHSIDSLEWRGVARVEGLATFFALTAWFDSGAANARSCFGDGDGAPCTALTVEFAEPASTCSGAIGRAEGV